QRGGTLLRRDAGADRRGQPAPGPAGGDGGGAGGGPGAAGAGAGGAGGGGGRGGGAGGGGGGGAGGGGGGGGGRGGRGARAAGAGGGGEGGERPRGGCGEDGETPRPRNTGSGWDGLLCRYAEGWLVTGPWQGGIVEGTRRPRTVAPGGPSPPGGIPWAARPY